MNGMSAGIDAAIGTQDSAGMVTRRPASYVEPNCGTRGSGAVAGRRG
jgi:hypothetical protein